MQLDNIIMLIQFGVSSESNKKLGRALEIIVFSCQQGRNVPQKIIDLVHQLLIRRQTKIKAASTGKNASGFTMQMQMIQFGIGWGTAKVRRLR
ncbi:MAG: hypothetical protein IPG32_17960 [Saprospirales bacterium]|nr:hypothetical protein [Saprospirales bacterium]